MRLGLALLLSGLVAVPALGQTRAETEARLAGLREQVRGVEGQVRRARTQETSALRALEGIDAEILLRQQLVEGYQDQTDVIRAETQELRRTIERLESEIDAAKASYRGRARHAYMHGRRNALALILSAGSVNQMIVRARYLQQFAQQRKAEVEQIAEKTTALRSKEEDVRASLAATERLLERGRAERDQLASRRRERAALVVDLKSRRGRLERELDQRRADAASLAGLVRDLAAQEQRRAEEARRQAEAARQAELARQAEAARQAEIARQAEVQRQADEAARRAAEARTFRRSPDPRNAEPRAAEPAPAPPRADPQPSPPLAEARPAPARPAPARPAPTPRAERAPEPEARPAPASERPVNLSGSFRQNRGRLPRPAAGTVVGGFGKRTDPVYGTTVSSIGVDIATAPAAPVRVVFEGVVERVGTIATYGTYVMVSHGDYVTIYGNLSGVSVRQGQQVRAGQAVGRAGTADSRRGSQLFFALFDNGEAVNPVGWLR